MAQCQQQSPAVSTVHAVYDFLWSSLQWLEGLNDCKSWLYGIAPLETQVRHSLVGSVVQYTYTQFDPKFSVLYPPQGHERIFEINGTQAQLKPLAPRSAAPVGDIRRESCASPGVNRSSVGAVDDDSLNPETKRAWWAVKFSGLNGFVKPVNPISLLLCFVMSEDEHRSRSRGNV